MKKTLIIVIAVVFVLTGAIIAYADPFDNEFEQRQQEMLEYKQDQLDELVGEGRLTREEADAILAEIEERIESGFCFGYGDSDDYDGYQGCFGDEDFSPRYDNSYRRGFGGFGGCFR